MAPNIVIDSGILLAIFLKEPSSAKSVALLNQLAAQNLQLVAPTLLRYEVISVIRKAVVQSRITTSEAASAINIFFAQSIIYEVSDALLLRGYDFATQLGRPVAYDAQYLAVAERYQCDFWTADERLFNAVSNTLPWVKWLGNFTDQN